MFHFGIRPVGMWLQKDMQLNRETQLLGETQW